MHIAIQSRNVEVSDGLREAVEAKLAHITRLFTDAERIEVCFTEERNPRISEKEVCDVAVHAPRETVRAHAAAGDVLTALDRVVSKLEHRIEKVRGKVAARRTRTHAQPDSLRTAALAGDLDV